MNKLKKKLIRELHASFLKIKNMYNDMERIPRDFGTGDILHLSEIQTIREIGENSLINITELALKQGITKGAVSQKVNRLLHKGFVLKAKKRNNEKEVLVKLTRKGKKVFKTHQENYDKMLKYLAGLVEGHGIPMESIALYIDLSKKIEKIIDKYMKEAM